MPLLSLSLLLLVLPSGSVRYVTDYYVITNHTYEASATTFGVGRFDWSFSTSEINIRGAFEDGARRDLDLRVFSVAEREDQWPGEGSWLYSIPTRDGIGSVPLYKVDAHSGETVIAYCLDETDQDGWVSGCGEAIYFSSFRPSSPEEVTFFGVSSGQDEPVNEDVEPLVDTSWDESAATAAAPSTEWIYFGGRRLRAGVSSALFMYSDSPAFGSTQASRYLVQATLFEDGATVKISFTDSNTHSFAGPLMNRGDARLFLSDGSTILLTDRNVRGVSDQEGGSSYRYSVYQLTPSEVGWLRRLGVSSVEFPQTMSRRMYPVEPGWSNGLRDQVRALGR